MWEAIDEGLRSWLTLVIAGIALSIAYFQYRNTKSKIKMDLFDRRMAIYESTKIFLKKISRDAKISLDDAVEFRRDYSHARFLFGSDVNAELKSIFEHALELATLIEESDVLDGDKKKESIKRKFDEVKWLVNRFENVDSVMSPYLDFHNIKS